MIDKSNSKKNTKKKRIKSEIIDSPRNSGAFFLQKYEIIIMLLGAGIISVLIFFVFLKPSGEMNLFDKKGNTDPVTTEDFQKQISRLADMVEKSGLKGKEKLKTDIDKSIPKNTGLAYEDHEKRIERIEASLSIKYETLANRISRLERNIDKMSKKLESYKRIQPAKVVKQPIVKKSKKKVVKTSKKKETKKAVVKKKESIFHTVKKGDTLYSLSKQYGTRVSELEKINHLPKNANIYPGDNLLVK